MPKRLAETKPDAVYGATVQEFPLGAAMARGRWIPVEVRRYGHLLLGFRIEGGKAVPNYSYVGYDKATVNAEGVDKFYLAAQSGDIKAVRQLSDELEKSGSLDFDMECVWLGLESRVGDREVASRIRRTVNARKDPLVPKGLFEKAVREVNPAVLMVLGYMVEHASNGCTGR